MKRAIIFDMDGVIVNTGPIGLSVLRENLKSHTDSDLTEKEIERYLSISDKEFFDELVQDRKLIVTSKSLLETQLKNYEIELKKDVHPNHEICDLINVLSGKYQLAICSGSTRGQIDIILEKLELTDLFECVVSSDDVTVGKPNPEGYIKSTACLNVHTDEAIIIEDSPAGVAAGVDAGIDVIQYGNDKGRESTLATHRAKTIHDITNILINL